MKLLGIDFGLKKVGFALSEGKLAEPFLVIKYLREDQLIRKIRKIVEEEKIERVVIGVSEGEMAQKAREFGEKLKEFVDVHFQDETLTTQDAISFSIKAGVKKEKRKKFEDAFAASIMLQSYVDMQA